MRIKETRLLSHIGWQTKVLSDIFNNWTFHLFNSSYDSFQVIKLTPTTFNPISIAKLLTDIVQIFPLSLC